MQPDGYLVQIVYTYGCISVFIQPLLDNLSPCIYKIIVYKSYENMKADQDLTYNVHVTFQQSLNAFIVQDDDGLMTMVQKNCAILLGKPRPIVPIMVDLHNDDALCTCKTRGKLDMSLFITFCSKALSFQQLRMVIENKYSQLKF